jgi:proteasome lid subunit RPN8/RPN11
MSASYSDFFPERPDITPIEKQAFSEYEVFRKLQSAGLWSVNISIAPSPLFRVTVHIPGRTVDLYGSRSRRDNFFFYILYPRFFRRSKPMLVWPGDADVPDLPSFRSSSIFYSSLTFERHLSRWSGPRFRGASKMDQRTEKYPSVELALQVCRSLDETFTRQKLVEVGLLDNAGPDKVGGFGRAGHLDEGSAGDVLTKPRPKNFTIKPERKFLITASSTDALPPPQRNISEIALLGQRLDTVNRTSGPALYIDSRPLKAMREHIRWDRSTADNRVEQGGLIVGEVIRGPSQETTALITDTLPALGTQGSAAYVKFDHHVWMRMFDRFESFVESGRITGNQKIIGWYHTHPNMQVFMSGTDMGTQQALFSKPWNYALVLNPQQLLCACFRGEMATPAPLIEVRLKASR